MDILILPWNASKVTLLRTLQGENSPHIVLHMSSPHHLSNEVKGIGLALLAVIIWGGNFVIARSVVGQIGPVSLGFFRWLIASVIMIPIAWTTCKREWNTIRQNIGYLSITALFGITLFNTLVYVAGHYTGAINMAMIGTTSSPIFSILLAFFILKEQPGLLRIAGIIICISGILWLLSGGNWQHLLSFHLSTGDIWVLGGAFCFAVYNIQVRRKPPTISSTSFLLVVFSLGTLFLLPGMIWEVSVSNPIQWSPSMVSMLLYLGAGTSVISFLAWNAAIAKIGIGRTVLFGYLIPLVSSLEAVVLLGEKFSSHHLIGAVLISIGLVLTNISPQQWFSRKKEVL